MVLSGHTAPPDISKSHRPVVMPGDRIVRVTGCQKEALLGCIHHFFQDRLRAEVVDESSSQVFGIVFDDDFAPLVVETLAHADRSSSFLVFKHMAQNNPISFRSLVASVATFLKESGQQVMEPPLEKEDEFDGFCDFEFDDLGGDCLPSKPSWLECIDAEVPKLAARNAWHREESLQVLASMAHSQTESRTPLARALGNECPTLLPSMIASIGSMPLREAYPFAAILLYSTSEKEGAALMKPFGDSLSNAVSKAHFMSKLVTSVLVHALANIAAHMITPCTTRRNQHLGMKTKDGMGCLSNSPSGRTTAASMRPSHLSMGIEEDEWHGSMIDEDQLSSLDLNAPTLDMLVPG